MYQCDDVATQIDRPEKVKRYLIPYKCLHISYIEKNFPESWYYPYKTTALTTAKLDITFGNSPSEIHDCTP
jgi:hypothetical protein